MRNTTFITILSVSLLLCSCNPRISTQLYKHASPIPDDQDVTVIRVDEPLPSKGIVLGEVSIGDAGLTTNCSYEYVVELAKVEARKAGGNALKITKHTEPDFYSSCHRIVANILLIDRNAPAQSAQDTVDASNNLATSMNELSLKVKVPKTRFAVYGGLSQVLGKNPEETDPVIDQYNKDLNSGYNVGADFTYFYSDKSGFGIKCNMLRTSNSLNDVFFYDQNHQRYFGDISDDVTLLFVGPSYNYRTIGASNKGALYFSASAGYNGYYNQACIINRMILSGSALGTSVDVGYDFNVSKNLGLALKLSLTSGVLKKMTIDNGTIKEQYSLNSDSYVSLSHIDFTVGFSLFR